MPDTPVTVQFAAPPPDFCPGTFEETVDELNLLVSASIPGTNTPYLVQDSTPTVGEQTYIWFKTVSGKPTGIYKFYDGLWRKVYTGSIGDVKLFSGDPAPVFDGTGKGIPGGEQDGWYLCNGQNATPNLSDKFIVAAHMDGSGAVVGYSGGWRTTVDGSTATTGGAATKTMTSATSYYPARPAITVYEWEADGNAPQAGGSIYGEVTTPGSPVTLQSSDAGNTSPTAFSIIPPYYALAYCKFLGY